MFEANEGIPMVRVSITAVELDRCTTSLATCFHCRYRMCFTCQARWRAGMTYMKYQQSLRDQTTATYSHLQQNTMACPSCGRMITKSGGCDHIVMTELYCVVLKGPIRHYSREYTRKRKISKHAKQNGGGCSHEVCWRCLWPYENIMRHGNHHHKPTCVHYFAYNREEEWSDEVVES
ncbi:hypothetical protein SeMB42_g07761 [Synchytrium endobioticum]|uniref:RING-type domain-containing protein n=1 Tax=Synchytrium endobioticum TaxID=286115 RepID=A0A507BVA7_9FUNG|nr:hypothetical protein SeMB42_g07761 [Synchytrium endobioticum]